MKTELDHAVEKFSGDFDVLMQEVRSLQHQRYQGWLFRPGSERVAAVRDAMKSRYGSLGKWIKEHAPPDFRCKEGHYHRILDEGATGPRSRAKLLACLDAAGLLERVL